MVLPNGPIKPGQPRDPLTRTLADARYAEKAATETALGRVDPGAVGSARELVTIANDGALDWWKRPFVSLDVDIGMVPNDPLEAANNSTKLQAYITSLPGASRNDGRTILCPEGAWYIEDGIDLSGKYNLVFLSWQGPSMFDGAGLGATFVTTVAGTDIFTHDNPSELIHQGPRFYNINMWDAAGSGRCVYLRNVVRSGFSHCVFRGPDSSSGASHSTSLVYGTSDSTGSGGSISGGDASWTWFDHCVWTGLFLRAIESQPFGFTLTGGEITGGLGTGIYGFGYMCKAFGTKMDVAVPLDWCGHGNEFHIFAESTGENYPIRLGKRAANADPLSATISDNTETHGNRVFGHITGRVPSPTGIVEFGSRAVDSNFVDLSVVNITSGPLVIEDAAVAGRNSYILRDREGNREQHGSDPGTSGLPAWRYFFRGGAGRDGMHIRGHSGEAATSVVWADSQYGTAGAFATVFDAKADGSFHVLKSLAHGAGSSPTAGFFGATPVSKPTVTGTTDTEKVNSLIAALASLGLVTDSTS